MLNNDSAWPRFVLAVLSPLILALAISCETDPYGAASWPWKSESPVPVFKKLVTPEEDNGIGSPDVIIDMHAGSRFTMAFAQGGTDGKGRIGMARSVDGISWERAATSGAASVLVPGGSGSWDGWFLDTPCILKRDGTWYLWYFGTASNETPGGAIGLATSSDGLNFVRASSVPVLAKGADADWDGLWVESPSVVLDGARFVMYYTGVDASWRPRMGRATSADGIVWVKDAGNPVLDRGESGQWDSYAAAVADAILVGDRWMLFYCAQSEFDTFFGLRVPKVGLATSMDGSTFSRYGRNPVVNAAMANYAPDGPYNPCVVLDDVSGRYLLWYETGIGFGLASASAP